MPVPGRGRVAAELVPPPLKALGVVDREALGVVGREGVHQHRSRRCSCETFEVGRSGVARVREVGKKAVSTEHTACERGQGVWLLAHADEIKPVIAMRGSGGSGGSTEVAL